MLLYSADTPVVEYGLTKESMTSKSTGTSKTYKGSDMCGIPANLLGFLDPGYIHDVLLVDLSPVTKYYYSFGSEKVGDTFKFLVAIHSRL